MLHHPLRSPLDGLLIRRNKHLVLSGGFAEGAIKSLDYEPPEDSDLGEDYDYVSDSDLEDDDEAAESAVGDQNLNVTTSNPNELANQGKVVTLRGVSYLTSVRVMFL